MNFFAYIRLQVHRIAWITPLLDWALERSPRYDPSTYVSATSCPSPSASYSPIGKAPDEIVQHIAAIWILSDSDKEDSVHWNLASDGCFSVSSAYHSQFSPLRPSPYSWDFVWKLPCTAKQHLFLWRLAQNSLPTASLLHNRGLVLLPTCFRCSSDIESALHALRDCPKSKKLWSHFQATSHCSNFFSLDLQSW
nr:reverse transcriptase [Solanum melongena]WMB97093.1 reverse transcriptase [Solanum aethiopicum]